MTAYSAPSHSTVEQHIALQEALLEVHSVRLDHAHARLTVLTRRVWLLYLICLLLVLLAALT